jgi:hypothetical protein
MRIEAGSPIADELRNVLSLIVPSTKRTMRGVEVVRGRLRSQGSWRG